MGENAFKLCYLIKDMFSEYVKHFYNSIIRDKILKISKEYLSRESQHVVSKLLKRCLILLCIREMQIKTIVKMHR